MKLLKTIALVAFLGIGMVYGQDKADSLGIVPKSTIAKLSVKIDWLNVINKYDEECFPVEFIITNSTNKKILLDQGGRSGGLEIDLIDKDGEKIKTYPNNHGIRISIPPSPEINPGESFTQKIYIPINVFARNEVEFVGCVNITSEDQSRHYKIFSDPIILKTVNAKRDSLGNNSKLLVKGVFSGADAPQKPVVDYGIDIGENGRKEASLAEELWSFKGTNVINKQQFNDLLKRYSDLMTVGRVTNSQLHCGEIRRQTAFFDSAYDLWFNHPELKDKETTKLLKEMSDSVYTLIQEHQIPNYTPKPYKKLSVAICGEPTQQWKDFVATNEENGRENWVQKTIQESLNTMDGCTRNIDDVIANKSYGSNSFQRDERPLFFYSNGVFQKVSLPWSTWAQ